MAGHKIHKGDRKAVPRGRGQQAYKDLLSEQELLYVRAWRGNNTEAAIAAGYAEKYAGENAGKLMKRPRVIAALRAKQEAILLYMGKSAAEQLAEHGLTVDKFFAELAYVALDRIPHEKRGFADKNDALRMWGEILGPFRKPEKVTAGMERGINSNGTLYEAQWVTKSGRGNTDPGRGPAPLPALPAGADVRGSGEKPVEPRGRVEAGD